MPTSPRIWRGLLAAGVAGVVAAVGFAPGQVGAAPPPDETKTKHVLVIGVDGLMWNRVAAANAPTLDRISAEGTFGQSLLYANPMADTVSGPGWATILTGTWPDQHGVRDNSFEDNRLSQHPDFLTRMERARPSTDTWAGADWPQIDQYILSDEIDQKVLPTGEYLPADRVIARSAADHLRTDQADATFAYFANQDSVGHTSGVFSNAYLAELANVDAYVSQMLAAIEARPTRASEDWLVLMSSDHGFEWFGHAGGTIATRSAFVLAWGDNVPSATPKTTRHVDTAATALAHLGVTGQADLDGRSVLAADTDPFEKMRSQLKSASTEWIPSSYKGWTQALPAGWSQTVGMSPTGVPEWRGWTMTTDEFWSQTEAGQSRETFVRGRGVIAVADSDEWADAWDSSGVRFDATLWAPAAAVSGERALEVDLTHYYRQHGDSIADIVVRFDGGTTTVAKSFAAETSGKRETVRIQVPAGAQTARVGFRHAGTNAWYWAIDDVKLRAVT